VVVTLVFDARLQRTEVVGLDARDLAARPLFVAPLKHHVPFSLHGTFAPARQGPG
jgi:all-trans-8'-apo-beta-carotenal 15,15'-oxygenase